MRFSQILRHPAREREAAPEIVRDHAPIARPSRRAVLLVASGALAALAVAVVVAVGHGPLRRRIPFPAAVPQATADVEIAGLPVEQWTARFVELERAARWTTLVGQLDAIKERHPDLYQAWRLAYLHGRARFEAGDLDEAAETLRPFLAPDDPLRDLALYYAAQVADERAQHEEASRLRQQLLFELAQATYRDAALGEEAAYLQRRGNLEGLQGFARRLAPRLEPAQRRDLEARVIELLVGRGDASAVPRGLKLLKENLADDAAERTMRALDRPELLERMGPEDWALLGESARNHRRFDEAVGLLTRAVDRLPARRQELLFSIGRAHFGAERFAEAEKTYLQGASAAKGGEERATFYYHASRAAQLMGDDARAERHMSLAAGAVSASAAKAPARSARGSATRTKRKGRVPPKTARRGRGAAHASASALPTTIPAGAAALTQRLRTRLAEKRFAEAATDLRLIRARFSGDAAGDADVAYAVAMVAAGRPSDALDALQAVAVGADKQAAAEAAYWRARAEEPRDPAAAAADYLRVLRAEVPTHFAYFARRRLAEPPLSARVEQEVSSRAAEVDRLKSAGDLDRAREVQTEVVLLSPPAGRAGAVETLRDLYRQLPRYREVLELQPLDFPRFPSAPPAGAPPSPGRPDRLELLLSMGLFDDAIDLVAARYPLAPVRSALARSLALFYGSAPRASIAAVETLMKSVPSDYLPELLPRAIRELLYPRYFYDVVVEQSRRHRADPRLVLSIMREESRFDPRAKSAAAARGLLQFIITTARDVGRGLGLLDLSSEDLYDPRIIIQLGAKYIADLLAQFGDDPYKAAAAYNAGPFQVRLWSRLSPDPGDDSFLSSVNFDETKGYVRKVLNSYERYGEIYEDRGPVGGLRVEP